MNETVGFGITLVFFDKWEDLFVVSQLNCVFKKKKKKN